MYVTSDYSMKNTIVEEVTLGKHFIKALQQSVTSIADSGN